MYLQAQYAVGLLLSVPSSSKMKTSSCSCSTIDNHSKSHRQLSNFKSRSTVTNAIASSDVSVGVSAALDNIVIVCNKKDGLIPDFLRELNDTILNLDGIHIVDETEVILQPAVAAPFSPNRAAIYIMIEDSVNKDIENDSIRLACQYDLYVSKDSIPSAVKRLNNLIQKINTDAPTVKDTMLDAGIWSHFVSLTFPSIDEAVINLPQLRIGADAFELRVDLLSDISVKSLHRQISLLRDTVDLPIVFTVRSKGQIGSFPDDKHMLMFQLLKEGVRAGCEWIDVEACWPHDITQELCRLVKDTYSTTSRLLGSLHVTVPQSLDQSKELFIRSSLDNKADVLKVVTGASNDNDCHTIHEAGQIVTNNNVDKEYIGVCLGANGSLSRVLNRRFTPVTHPLMAAAAPGQLTVEQLMEKRVALGLCKPKNFYLFGSPIKQSLSPAMHNAAFKALHLPHFYSINENDDVNAYADVISGKSFGGASVTIPHKETIIRYLDEVHGAAAAIGAVNTIVIDADTGKKIGYNTDWLGIKNPLQRKLRSKGGDWNKLVNNKRPVGLVIGAGGTAKAACYAIQSLGLDVVVCNRSPEKAAEVSSSFNGSCISLDALLMQDGIDSSLIQVVVSTLPASANFVLPEYILERKPVIFDVVYKPAKTALIAQAIENNCMFVQGATMLFEQGCEQFQLWNHRRAPRTEMENAIFNGVEKL